MKYINRNNYETFFLLYADNELSVEEKMAVDEFVQTNQDLEEELLMFKQSILRPDNIVFDDKSSLLKNTFTPVVVQQKLLLHLDNELTAKERNELKTLIGENADIKSEWNILQQTKLLPGSPIVFEDKQSLYRKKTGSLVTFSWRRFAAAAIFIGFGVWGGWVYFNSGDKLLNTEIANNTKPEPIADTNKLATKEMAASLKSSVVKENEITATPVITRKASTETKIQLTRKVSPRTLVNRDIEIIAVNEKPKTNNLPAPYSDNVNNAGSNKTINAYVKPKKQTNTLVNSVKDDMADNSGSQGPSNGYASAASYTENSADNNNNRVLFMDEEKLKKTKLGGIFRKVKRVLERSANIKPGGNNIKVANLEFAIQ